MNKKIYALISAILVMAMLLTACTSFQEGTEAPEQSSKPTSQQLFEDVVVLYTNDIHCAVDGYTTVAQTKAALEAAGKEVILVDCGDAVQGETIGALSNGEYIIEIMNELGYVVSSVGNHDFDYGAEQFMKLSEMASFEYVSCNIVDKNGELVFDPYKIVEAGGHKIAFVGILTPETMVTTRPSNICDADGNYLYDFYQDTTGEKLYAAVQSAVDSAKAEGADVVVALAHLGINAGAQPWTSSDVITHTTGIDVMLDAHSHSVMEQEMVKNKDGKNIPLTSTGTKFANIGCLLIGADGTFRTSLINDNGISALVDEKKASLAEITDQVVAHTEVSLTISDPEIVDANGKPIRIVRSQETNLGDLCADAYRAATGADIALVNGGGVRESIAEGDITYGQIIAAHPFGNELCVKNVTGQILLDVLEMSVRNLPDENGGFMQVSGISFDVDVNVPSSVEVDEGNAFVNVSGDRRVSNVMVNGEALDLEKTYTVVGSNFLLKEGGDGYTMLKDCEMLLDSVILDYQALINYITDDLGGSVGDEYADPYGEGRINIIQ